MEKISYKGKELKNFAMSLLLTKEEFPTELSELPEYFSRESLYNEPSALAAAKFIENGYIGTIIHSFENENSDEKSTKHQFLAIVYNPCFFLTAEGASKTMEIIKTKVKREDLAQSFMLQKYIGIDLNIKPISQPFGDDSYSFIVDGHFQKDDMDLDFNTTIILFRVGPILTVINTLSIGELDFGEIEKIINILERKIRKALGA